jgi:RHS repeat-associated protein
LARWGKTDSLDTDAFGMNVASTGTTPTPFGFAGQHGYHNDSVTGLMRLGHRYYDASVGRFLSRDPIQDGYNWYAYVNNDPVNKIDPKGLGWWPWPWGGDIYNSTDKPILVIGEPGRGKKQKKIWIAPGKSDPPNFDADHYLDPNDGKWHDIKGNGFRGGSVTVEEGFTRHGGPINDYDKQREHPYKKRYFSGPYPNYVGGEGANGTP